MTEREVNSPVCVQSCNHGYWWRDGPQFYRRRGKRSTPSLSLKVGLWQPCLVDVDDSLSLSKQSHEWDSKLLSEDKTPLIVCPRCHFSHLSIDQVHLLCHHVGNQLRSYRNAVVFRDLLLNLFTACHRHTPIQKVVGGRLDDCNFANTGLLSLFSLSQLLWLSLCHANQFWDQIPWYSVLPGYFILAQIVFEATVYDLFDLISW